MSFSEFSDVFQLHNSSTIALFIVKYVRVNDKSAQMCRFSQLLQERRHVALGKISLLFIEIKTTFPNIKDFKTKLLLTVRATMKKKKISH